MASRLPRVTSTSKLLDFTPNVVIRVSAITASARHPGIPRLALQFQLELRQPATFFRYSLDYIVNIIFAV
jgi:hypothetical protein